MLMPPTASARESFLVAMEEHESVSFADADGLTVGDLRSEEVFARYVADLTSGGLPWQRTHAGAIVRVFWWVVDGSEYIGRISVRPDLDPNSVHDGHIGYAVRPSRRREGHATAMLAAALPIAWSMGANPARLVCRIDNSASQRVIERNGGILHTTLGDRHHYLCHRP